MPTRTGSVALPQQNGRQPNHVSLPNNHFENWGESTMADASPRTDTSTDDEKNQLVTFSSKVYFVDTSNFSFVTHVLFPLACYISPCQCRFLCFF